MKIQAGHLISQIKRLADQALANIVRESNIPAFDGAQGRVLYLLWQEDRRSLRELADRTGLPATTLTGVADRMEAAGWVERVPDPRDRRKTLLALTRRASALRADYEAVSDRMTARFYRGFTPEEIAQCESLLCRIRDNLTTDEQKGSITMANTAFLKEKVQEMMAAFSCSQEAKAAGQAWLDAVGTENEAAQTKALIAELEGDIMPAEMLEAFAASEMGAKVFGENAPGVVAHAKDLQAQGKKYCDCPACQAVEAILAKKDELL